MCGITGIFDLKLKHSINRETLVSMTNAIKHRGPDEFYYLVDDNIGLGFRRLSIIDVANGHQPLFNRDNSIILICNGEIYNYKELRKELISKGYTFKTNCDVEVILYMYEAYGTNFLNRLNGQFAFAIIDKNKNSFFLARDHFGICPLFYAMIDDVFIFGSEVKAILQHPLVKRTVNLTGLDLIFSFPGLASPVTMFDNIHSLSPGNFIFIENAVMKVVEYWDLEYPESSERHEMKSENYYAEGLEELLYTSVNYRLNSEVPVGFYLSGGLDSSLLAAMMKRINPGEKYESFSVCFPKSLDSQYDESYYQGLMVSHLNSNHNQINFDWSDVAKNIRDAIYYSESPLKETYNTCSLALSRRAAEKKVKVILSGEGADELLGGYIGYRFDKERSVLRKTKTIDDILEDEIRAKLWDDPDFFYELNQYELKSTKQSLYSEKVNERYPSFDCLDRLPINKNRIRNRHVFNKRSYVDLKLRLSDHLIADHCDRVTYANSIEGRYPFLDINVVEFIRLMPPEIKLKGLVEKYILKKVASKYLPSKILERQKFSFVAPDSSQLIKNNIEWVNDALSYDSIKRQGYFDPNVVERLKKKYRQENFHLSLPFDTDLLIVVLTFNIFLEVFDMPSV